MSVNTHNYVPQSAAIAPECIDILLAFIKQHSGSLMVLTGAGVSTESGIPDYRSEMVGLYARTDKRPTTHLEFMKNEIVRQRYWARSYTAWNNFSKLEPNLTHKLLANLENNHIINWLATQNVDYLHTKAGSQRITEMHGNLYRVKCTQCENTLSRVKMQERMQILNPKWNEMSSEMAPDGDVTVDNALTQSFKIPKCLKCNGALKTDVIFFGDNMPKQRVDLIENKIKHCTGLLVLGSSLQVFSAYRVILQAKQYKLQIGIVNIGNTRADRSAEFKISGKCSEALERMTLYSS